MTDFHIHVLPGIDDGAESPEVSYEMLWRSREQGVDTVVATPHFYPFDESPEEFLRRRRAAADALKNYVADLRKQGKEKVKRLPMIYLAAEVYFFPTLGTCESLELLSFGKERFLLIEPPMTPFTDSMLNEIELARRNFGYLPVIAHVDRYARMLGDYGIFRMVRERGFLVQVNSSFFRLRETAELAVEMLKNGEIAMIGSDAHNLDDRPPNLEEALYVIQRKGAADALENLIAL